MNYRFQFHPLGPKDNSFFFADLPSEPIFGDYISSELFDSSVLLRFNEEDEGLVVDSEDMLYVRGREFSSDGRITYLLGFNPRLTPCRFKIGDKLVFKCYDRLPLKGDIITYNDIEYIYVDSIYNSHGFTTLELYELNREDADIARAYPVFNIDLLKAFSK